MMGFENEGGAHPDDMQTLILDDPLLSSSCSGSNYETVITPLSDSNSNHPLSFRSIVVAPADSDPLLSPLQGEDHISSKDNDFNSHFDDSDYSDVFVNPILGEAHNGGETNGIGSPKVSFESFSRSELGSEYLHITVLNPQKEHEVSNSIVPGGNTYVTYLISTKTNMRGFGGSDFSVRRRFRDVVTLADRLSESYRGFFIPPRPDKSVVESQVMHKQEFVEQRRLALEKYLRKLAAHPVIRTSEELRVFLQVPGKLPLRTSIDIASRMLDGAANLPKQLFGDSRNVVASHEAVQPAKGRRDLLRLFRELKQSVTSDWGNSKPAVVEEDKEFLEKKDNLFDFEHRLTDVSKQVILCL